MIGVRMSTDRGPWIATSAIASDRSSRTALKFVSRSASASLTTGALEALATTRNRSGPEPVDDEIVDDAAVGRADHRVVGPALLQRRRIRDEGEGEGVAGVRALDEQLAHVRQVEEAGPLADGAVLLEDAGVLERHQPAAELDELRAERHVSIVERRLVDPGIDRVGHVRRPAWRALPGPQHPAGRPGQADRRRRSARPLARRVRARSRTSGGAAPRRS